MHGLIHAAVNFAVAYLIGLGRTEIIIVTLAGLLIDLDHVLDLLHKEGEFKKYHLKYAFNVIQYQKDRWIGYQKSLHLFHAPEFILLTAIMSYFYPILIYVSLGLILHVIVDMLGNIYYKTVKSGIKDWYKHLFLTYYVVNWCLVNNE